MAQPAGSVTCGSYKYDMTGTESTPIYSYIILRVPRQPQIFNADGKDTKLYRLGLSYQRKITDATEDIEHSVWAGNTTPIAKDVPLVSSASPAWNQTEDPLVYHGKTGTSAPEYPAGLPFYIFDVDGPDDRYSIVLIEVEWQSKSAVDVGDVLDVYAAFIDVFGDITDPKGFDGEGYKYYDRATTSTNIDADECVSAWEIMWALSDTYERFLDANRPSFCVPLFGAAVLVP